MQTYGNLMSNQGYHPHLDSSDFIRFLRGSVIVALLLAMAFSCRGNFLGLSQTLERNWFWLMCISAGVTITSSLLAMLTVIRIEGLSKFGRVLIGLAAVIIFYISTRLTLIGFGAGEMEKLENVIRENPEVIEAKAELDRIIERQNEYGISQNEKLSLMAREKEQRAWIREIEKRVLAENKNRASKAERSVGTKEMMIARQAFALAPDIAIAVLSPLLVLLFGAAGLTVNRTRKDESPGETKERIIYVPIQANLITEKSGDNGAEKLIGQSKKPEEIQTMVQDSGNGAKRAQIEKWNPFQ
jgi:hypothetical protein